MGNHFGSHSGRRFDPCNGPGISTSDFNQIVACALTLLATATSPVFSVRNTNARPSISLHPYQKIERLQRKGVAGAGQPSSLLVVARRSIFCL
jgi:hypothetical protein